ncbi:MAG: hypothetical protein V4556_01995 [Bacteroidota bacterium]
MKRILIIFLAAAMNLTATSQVNVTVGGARGLKWEKNQKVITSASVGDDHYFVIRTGGISNQTHTLLSLDKNGNTRFMNEVKFDPGEFKNGNYINSMHVVGNKLLLLTENRDKDAGQNTLIIRTVQSDATVNKDEVKVGSFEFTKLMKPGDWYAAVTPDKKHLMVAGKLPAEKDESDKLKLFLLDENLKVIAKKDVSLPEGKRKIHFRDMLASDKGDVYLIENAYDKTYQYPIIYKASVSSPEVTTTPVQLEDGSIKSKSYVYDVSPSGDLIVAGYYQKKSGFTVGEVDAFGTWYFNASKPTEVKVFKFDKAISSMEARGIVFNGNTSYLIGEQYIADRLKQSTQQMMSFDENFDYTHKDIVVTAFDETSEKKFELRLYNNWKATNFDQSLYPAYTVMNDKLTIIYNDQYSKYFPAHSQSEKLPVLVAITNDGLMEAPVTFEKDLDPNKTGYQLYPQFVNSNGKNEIVLLAGNTVGIRGVIFRQ